MLRKLTLGAVEFSLEIHPEDIPIEGNCSAIDDETDASTERWIREQLERGNEWAWCTVVVKAQWNGFEASDALGACSYSSEKDFVQPGGYFDDMKANALAQLNDSLRETNENLKKLRNPRNKGGAV